MNRPDWGGMQVLASAVKAPGLFLGTLTVTFPSLYVFSALCGARLSLLDALRVAVAAITVTLAVLAAFAPITAFFTVNTDSYPFMVLLNVIFFAIAGLIGLGFLNRLLHRVEIARLGDDEPYVMPVEPVEAEDDKDRRRTALPVGTPPSRSRAARAVFKVWLILYAVVGAQMAWVLRPFVGSSGEFVWLRPRSGHFFEAMARVIGRLASGS